MSKLHGTLKYSFFRTLMICVSGGKAAAKKQEKPVKAKKEKEAKDRWDKTMKEYGELSGKYACEDANFDIDQMKKDIKTVQSKGYKSVEDIAEFLGLDEDEVREVLADTNDIINEARQKVKQERIEGQMQKIDSLPPVSSKGQAKAREFVREALEDELKNINNSKEIDMTVLEELKKLITRVENDKGENMEDDKKKEVDNEKVDKRKLIDEVGGILKGKVDDELIRTIIGKMEKMSYDESEAGTADNEKEEDDEVKNKKIKNEDKEDKREVDDLEEDEKDDVDNKCRNVKNARGGFFDKINEIYNSSTAAQSEVGYTSRVEREQAAVDYFTK